MPFYTVTLPAGTEAAPRPNGYNTQIVYAATPADALAACKSLYTSDNDQSWGAATTVELSNQADLSGVELRVTAASNADAYNRVYSFTGLANALLSDLVEGVKVAMVANATNFPSAPTRSGNVLTIPSGNNIGDLVITAGCYLNNVAIAGITVAVSSVGVKASARTITLSGGTMEAVRWRVTIADPTNPMDLSVYSHALETIDQAAARLVVLMDAHALIGGGGKVTYTAGSNTITVTGASAAQGAKVITAAATRHGAAVPELALTVNAPGIASIDRTIIFAADGTLPVPLVPKCVLACKV